MYSCDHCGKAWPAWAFCSDICVECCPHLDHKIGKSDRIALGLPEATNTPAEYNGNHGYWVQSDCVFVVATSPEDAIASYRQGVADAAIGISHNFGCAAIQRIREHRGMTRMRAWDVR